MELTKDIKKILEDIVWWDTCPTDYKFKINAYLKSVNESEALSIHDVSHSDTPNYLNKKYEVLWLINDTYQVEQDGNCVYQGSESDCNEWLKCELGYCG